MGQPRLKAAGCRLDWCTDQQVLLACAPPSPYQACDAPGTLSSTQEKEARPGDVAAANPKRERIKHASIIASKLSPAFSSHSPREQQVLAAAAGFRQRWAAGSGAGRLAPPVSLLNECGLEKVVCTTVRPASLPHTDLHDLADIAQVGGGGWGWGYVSCVGWGAGAVAQILQGCSVHLSGQSAPCRPRAAPTQCCLGSTPAL